MARLKRACFPVQRNPYGREVVFLYGTRAQLNRWVRRHMKEEGRSFSVSTRGRWVLWEDRDGFCTDYVFLVARPSASVAREHASLAHEVLHHAMHVMEHAGVKVTADNDEALTYYMEWVLRQCLEVLLG